MAKKKKTTNPKPRDLWIYNTWKTTKGGVHKSAKYTLPRKAKHKGLCDD